MLLNSNPWPPHSSTQPITDKPTTTSLSKIPLSDFLSLLHELSRNVNYQQTKSNQHAPPFSHNELLLLLLLLFLLLAHPLLHLFFRHRHATVLLCRSPPCATVNPIRGFEFENRGGEGYKEVNQDFSEV